MCFCIFSSPRFHIKLTNVSQWVRCMCHLASQPTICLKIHSLPEISFMSKMRMKWDTKAMKEMYGKTQKKKWTAQKKCGYWQASSGEALSTIATWWICCYGNSKRCVWHNGTSKDNFRMDALGVSQVRTERWSWCFSAAQLQLFKSWSCVWSWCLSRSSCFSQKSHKRESSAISGQKSGRSVNTKL